MENFFANSQFLNTITRFYTMFLNHGSTMTSFKKMFRGLYKKILIIKDVHIVLKYIGETGVLRATFFHSHKTAIKLSFSQNFKVAC